MLVIPPITIDDTVLTDNSVAETVAAYSASTVYKTDDEVRSDTTHRIYTSALGLAATVTMTIASPCVVTKAAHGYSNGTPVAFTTTGALPTGITAGTVYYLINVAADTFQIAATVGGTAINTSGSQSGTHTATFNPNKGNDPTTDDGSHWIDTGPTNPWAAFDYYRSTVTTDASPIEFEFTIDGRVNSIALLGLSGVTEVGIVATADAVEVYNQTFNLNSSEEVTGWWSYFFSPITTASELFVTDLPPYQDMVITVTLTGTGTIGVGTVSIGTSIYIGGAQYGAKVSGIDYGYKSIDQYGSYTYVQRGFSLRNDYTLMLSKSMTSRIVSTLRDLRGIPCVWIGSEDYSCTYNFGPYKEFDLTIAYPQHSIYTLSIEGLV